MLDYFAYGSNMHPARIAERVGSVTLVGAASAEGFRLAFHKRGRDGSGKCDMLHTGRPGDRVHGIVFRIRPAQKAALDNFEGVGRGYVDTGLTVVTAQGSLRAHRYAAQAGNVEASLLPFDWYKALVLAAARLHGFPPAYVRAIEEVESMSDPDPVRARLHRRLLDAAAPGAMDPGSAASR
jgi:hypothetical protein